MKSMNERAITQIAKSQKQANVDLLYRYSLQK